MELACPKFEVCPDKADGLLQFRGRQRFLRLLILAIVFNGDRVTIRGVIPVSENEATGNSTEESPQLGLSVSRSAAGNIATIASYPYGHNNNNDGVHFTLERAIVKRFVVQPRASNGQYCRAA